MRFLKVDEEPDDRFYQEIAKEIKSDGCTGVLEIHHNCCVVHDLGYRKGVDVYGRPVTRREVDAEFRRCNQRNSPLGRFSPDAWIRWAGVRVFGIGKFKGCKS